MDVITQMAYDIQQLQNRLANLLQTASVTAIYADVGRVDVVIDELPLEEIPFLTTRAGRDKTYWMPSVGEQGLVLSPSGDLANAIFLPAINSNVNPAPESEEKWTTRQWEDGARESYDKDAHEHLFQVDEDTLRRLNRDEIEDKVRTARRVIESDSITDEVGTAQQVVEATKVKHSVGASTEELTAIVLNLIGAHLFPSGITTLQSPVGPVFFAPASTPTTAPTPPVGSAPDDDGQVTQTPASTISGVSVQTVSTLNFTVPAIPVTTPGGAGTTVPTAISVAVTGTLTLQFPARGL